MYRSSVLRLHKRRNEQSLYLVARRVVRRDGLPERLCPKLVRILGYELVPPVLRSFAQRRFVDQKLAQGKERFKPALLRIVRRTKALNDVILAACNPFKDPLFTIKATVPIIGRHLEEIHRGDKAIQRVGVSFR